MSGSVISDQDISRSVFEPYRFRQSFSFVPFYVLPTNPYSGMALLQSSFHGLQLPEP